ncbi:MAG TPA: histidine phosphatase family protein, partial [Chlamydiales bacterium]|nr:histidine phosphatase family protein [Chlamydiales bacterium]
YEQLSAKNKYITPELPTGESQETGAMREIPTFQKIFDRYPEKLVLVVSHGRVMRTISLVFNDLLPRLSAEPGSALPTPKVENGDILVIEKPIGTSIAKARVAQHLSLKLTIP